MANSSLSLTLFLKNLYCHWRNSSTLLNPGDYYREPGPAGAPGVVPDIVDTAGTFGAVGASYSIQVWSDMNANALREVAGPYIIPIPVNVQSVFADLDALGVPVWVTGPEFISSIVINDNLGNREELAISSTLAIGRIFTFHFIGILNISAQQLILSFDRKKTGI